MVYTMMSLLVVSILLAALMKEKAETVFPGVLLAVIGILYPFYCLDLLRAGRFGIYCILAAAALYSVAKLRKNPDRILKAVTPGICLYGALCLFYAAYTQDHLVGLWDELRLWGAVPKALYATEALQLGKDALIFEIMQPYPPGMPLLVYFLQALSPEFQEGMIFAVYAMFFSAMLLPVLKGLRWKDYPFFLPLALVMICAPCLFTSHGGDGAWFYGSLYIDPILGALAGYAFYLSCTEPFKSPMAQLRFAVTLLVLTVIKDSGVMFALLAGLNAAVLDLTDRERNVRGIRWLLHPALAIVPGLLGYGSWKLMLTCYGITSNAKGFLRNLPTPSGIVVLLRNLKSMAMVSLQDPLFTCKLTLTYIPGFLIMVWLSYLTEKCRGKQRQFLITWASMCVSIGIFCLGYIMSFGTSLPSFQRYMSSTLILAMTFVMLRGLPVLLDWARGLKLIGAKRIQAIALSLVLVVCAMLFVKQWQGKKANMDSVIDPAARASRTISAVEGKDAPADVYVLIAENPRDNSKLHHRIYYEVLGTSACVRNFWNNVNIVGGETTPEEWTPEEITAISQKWCRKLLDGGYDYIYVAASSDFAAQVLAELGVDMAEPGDLFAIEWEGESILLVKQVQ